MRKSLHEIMQGACGQGTTQIIRSFIAAFFFVPFLFACGGGGGDSGSGTTTSKVLASISITPATASIAKGLTTSFAATGRYSDNTTADITSQVIWTSSNNAVATINTTGVATGVSFGGVAVIATLNDVSSPAAMLTVTSAVVTGIAISPPSASSPKSTPVTYTATGTFSDGTTGNISGSVTWASSNTAVATLNGSGIASTLAQGSTTITASTNNIISNSATLTVTAPQLASLSITPSSASITAGNTQQFSATGTLSDGTAATLGPLTWTSSDTSVATIDSTGLVTTLVVGSTNISASNGGIVSNTVVVTVVVPQPPAAPFGVFAVSGTNQATVSWSPVTDAAAYNIYWGTTPGITSASTKFSGATSPYLHTGLTTGSTYYYRVSAVNTGGETLSDEIFVVVYTGGNPAGSFSATGSLVTARQEHTATLLPDGKILVAGGHSQVTYFTGAELYDPATGLFSATANNMAAARYGHTATLLPNGKVMVAGGYNGAHLASAELYDPGTGLFSTTNSMAAARSNHTATLLPNGKLLIIGGANATGFLASAEVYDPVTGVFSSTGSMGVARRGHTATLLSDGKVMVTGGQNGANFLSSAEIYDSVTNSFSAVNGMTTGRVSHTATLLPNGQVLITGGFGGTGASPVYNISAELYDPATGTFSATGNMATARWLHAATLLSNGKVLISGGRNGDFSGIAVANVELYDPATGIFNATGNMVTARQYHTITLLPNGKVLATGGFNGGTSALSSAELFQ